VRVGEVAVVMLLEEVVVVLEDGRGSAGNEGGNINGSQS